MESGERPNLLYIHSDQHCPFVAGCYGDSIVQTPNLDGLAASGAVLDAAYCPSPICVPSRMSTLTGRYPHENAVWTNEHMLDSGTPTLAHALGAAEYQPVLVGRMHAIGTDQLHGYAQRLIGDHSSNFLGGSPVDRGALTGTAGPERVSLRLSGAGQSAYQVHDEYVTQAAIDFLNTTRVAKRAAQSPGPFCLSVGFMLPHPPYVARDEDYRPYEDTVAMPKKPVPYDAVDHPHLRWWRKHTGIESVTPAEVRRSRAAYWALVSRMDTMIGEILNCLRRNGLNDNTLIVYSSDHGDMLGEQGLWWKHTFYEESVRIPAVFSWPGHIKKAQRCPYVADSLDINATILDATGAPALPTSRGRSLLGILTGGDHGDNWRNEAYSEYCSDEYGPEGGCYQRMVRRDEWKLIYYHGQPPQLFNLREDPDERENRATDTGCRAILRDLTASVLKEWEPELIKAKMDDLKAERALLKRWTEITSPREQYRWRLEPGMNRIDQS